MSEQDAAVRTCVYRLYDDQDRLLYVGVTGDPQRRWRQHAATKAWWSQVATRVIEWHDSSDEAHRAEMSAVKSEYPAHNLRGALPPTPHLPGALKVGLMDAKKRLHVLVDLASSGQEVIICRNGEPLAMLSAYGKET